MKIHTVREGETIFSIARAYSTSPMKIIENNGLQNPDELSVGTELIIAMPTRTHTVRGGDTLLKIADRFSVSLSELYKNNPYLAGGDSLYPGQIISVKQDSAPYGVSSSIGYLFSGYSEEGLCTAIHYLTHLAIAAYKRDQRGRIKELFNPKRAISLCKSNSKIPLARIYDRSPYSSPSEEYINDILLLTEKEGYAGVITSPCPSIREESGGFEFLDALYEKMKERGLYLFVENNLNDKTDIKKSYDGVIMMYDKCIEEDIPTVAIEREIYAKASEEDPSKFYIDLPSFAYIGKNAISKEEALRIAKRGACKILHDKERGICHFSANEYTGGKKEVLPVVFESLENIKTKLTLIYELGLSGISFDVMRTPIEYLVAFHSSYSLPSI